MRLGSEAYHAVPGKLYTLLDLLESIFHNGEKCIAWTSFTENVDWLAKKLADDGAVKVHGKLSMDARTDAILSKNIP
jgi:superfamily II DNA/RNA helicase